MLAEAGWKPGPDGILAKDGQRFAFTLITNNGNETRKDVATLVQADLRNIGIEVKVEIYEWAVFLDKHVDTADFDALVLGWSLGVDYDQYTLWHSSQTNPKQLNFCAYKNPEVDHMLDDIRVEYDRDAIKRIAGQLQQTIYDDQPYLFLAVPNPITAMWKDTFRVLRPEKGAWTDEPIRETKAGAGVYQEWFYRPQYRPQVTAQ
jgi:peptide/nickel transport system substrate-binding protein